MKRLQLQHDRWRNNRDKRRMRQFNKCLEAFLYRPDLLARIRWRWSKDRRWRSVSFFEVVTNKQQSIRNQTNTDVLIR
jgi:hypothetical protein